MGHIKSMMAANCHDRYYRVLVTGFVSEDVVTALVGLFFDVRNSSEIAIWDLLAVTGLLCRQSFSARLDGIREEEGREIISKKRRQLMTTDRRP